MPLTICLAATAVGLAGGALGVWLTWLRRRAGAVVPFSAGVLLGVALFGLAPELAAASGWGATAVLFAAGYALLLVIDRHAFAHDHTPGPGAAELHSLAAPLLAGAALHSFLDGWGIAASQWATTPGVRIAVPLAVALHKLPEGIALGGILVASVKHRGAALGWCALAEAATLAGGAAALLMAPALGTRWTMYPLGLAAGWLFYLGFHAVNEEWKRRGAGRALLPAAAGIAGAAAIQRGAEALFR